jgi:glycosyltransferase involved in cell wall biosynthesis
MLVGIEVSSALPARRTGVGNYTLNLVRQLRRRENTGDACFLYFANEGAKGTGNAARLPGAGSIYPHDRLPTRTLWMQVGLPRSIARTRPDLCHFPNHLAPIAIRGAVPYVLTIHDMSVYRCPQHHSNKTVLMHRAIMPMAARGAALIITVSQSARRDILHYLNVPGERVRVVYEGVGPQFQPVSTSDEPAAEAIRSRYGLPDKYVLTVSTLEPRKNHIRLMEAFAQVVRRDRIPHHLVVVGARGWKDRSLREWVARNGLASRIHFPGYAADEHLPGLYRSASAFAFPSLYEGFGLPVLEAMACGVPCLISSDPALCEVAGQGNAVVADPLSVGDLAQGLHRLVTDDGLAGALRAAGLARAAAFGWQDCADQTYALYKEAVRAAAPAARGALISGSARSPRAGSHGIGIPWKTDSMAT